MNLVLAGLEALISRFAFRELPYFSVLLAIASAENLFWFPNHPQVWFSLECAALVARGFAIAECVKLRCGKSPERWGAIAAFAALGLMGCTVIWSLELQSNLLSKPIAVCRALETAGGALMVFGLSMYWWAWPNARTRRICEHSWVLAGYLGNLCFATVYRAVSMADWTAFLYWQYAIQTVFCLTWLWIFRRRKHAGLELIDLALNVGCFVFERVYAVLNSAFHPQADQA